MASAKEAKVKFTADTSEFTSQIQKANSTLGTLSAQMKLNAATFKSTGDAVAYYQNKQKLLQAELKANQEKQEALTNKLNVAKTIYGENSDEVATWTNKLIQAQTQGQNLQNALDQCENAMNDMAAATDKILTPTEKLTSTIQEQESELSELKQKYVDTALAYGQDSDQAQNLANKITDLSGDLNENKSKLDAVKEAADKAGQAVEDSGESAEKAGNGGWTTFKGIVSNLATQAIDAAINKIKEFASSVMETGLEFETANSQLAATMGTTTDQITELTEFAQEMGATTAYTATEAADGLNTLAMAGLDASEQIATLPNVMNLAQAGAIDLSTAAEYVTTSVKGFGDEMGNSQYYADLMAKGATVAATDVNGLGAALSSSAATASNYGQSAATVTLELLKLAEQGETGSAAATSLNRAMADLYTPTDTAAKALKEIGVSAYDASGNAKDFDVLCGELSTSLSGYTEEQRNAYLNTIFTTNGLQAYNEMQATSTEKAQEFKDALAGASSEMGGAGSAAQQAATQMDNLQGDLTLMSSASDGLKMELYDLVDGPIRSAVQTITNDVIPGITNVVSWMNQHKTITGLMVGALATLVTAIVAYNIAVNATAIATAIATTATTAFGAVMAFITSPITLVIAAIAAVIAIIVLCVTHWEQIKAAAVSAAKVIGSTVSSAWNALVSTITGVMSSIVSACKNGWNNAKTAVQSIIENIKSGVVNKFNALKSSVTSVFNAIRTAMTTPFTTAYNTIKSVINNIKSALNFTAKINLKVPHISITGGVAPYGIGGKGSLPKFNVSWNAKGVVFDAATIIPTLNHGLQGVGEAGPEAVAPISVLQDYVKDAVREVINYDYLATIFENTMRKLNITMNMNGREVGRALS